MDCLMPGKNLKSSSFDRMSEYSRGRILCSLLVNTQSEVRIWYKGFVYVREVELENHKYATASKFKRTYWRYKVKPVTAFRVDYEYYTQGDTQ